MMKTSAALYCIHYEPCGLRIIELSQFLVGPRARRFPWDLCFKLRFKDQLGSELESLLTEGGWDSYYMHRVVDKQFICKMNNNDTAI
jgi:hypothetical protein